MKTTPEISVIVPMYNAENYINKCIDSILGQTFTDFELLLIDDGSQDKSAEICKTYLDKDERVKLYQKSNGGTSSAKNYGLGVANGKYIGYVDSDDFITSDYLETLHDMIVKNDADIAVGNYREVYDDGEAFNSENSSSEYEVSVFSGKEALHLLLMTDKYLRMVTPWAKLIRADIAKNHLFPEGRVHEDEAISYLFYVDAGKVAMTDKVIYGYYQNQAGIMHSLRDDNRINDALYAFVSRATHLEEIGWDYEAGRAWLFVYGGLHGLVMEMPKQRWKWKETYKDLLEAKTLTGDIKAKAFLFMHIPYLFRAIQKKRGKV